MANEILVVIPYLGREAQGCELELAVAGWNKHFKEPHRVLVVGDWDEHVEKLLVCPDGKTEGSISFIDCPQIEPVEGQYLPHLDMVNKFKTVYSSIPAKGFIYACDDMYAVQDFTLGDVERMKVPDAAELPETDWHKERGWWRDICKTRQICKSNAWPAYNFVCHLPVYYDFYTLMMLYEWYEADRNSYVWENVYYNMMLSFHRREDVGWKEPIVVPEQGSEWKYEVKASNPGINSTDEARAIWITNANTGWSDKLERILREHYGEKS